MMRAIYINHPIKLETQRLPGSFYAHMIGEGQAVPFLIVCPCGCGKIMTCEVLPESASVTDAGSADLPVWSGGLGAATLDRPICLDGHWRGALQLGYWQEA